MLRIEDCITAIAPTPEMVGPLTAALAELSPADATSPDRLNKRLPHVVEVLGPATLSYRGDQFPAAASAVLVDVVPLARVAELLGAVTNEELEESGLAKVTSSVSVIRSEFGEPVAACGYQQWPEQIAHLSVLTRADHRGKRLAAAVAIDAVWRALGEGLLPQWRARAAASQAVARAIGFEEMGAQLSLRVDGIGR